jgi:hypothetical protein
MTSTLCWDQIQPLLKKNPFKLSTLLPYVPVNQTIQGRDEEKETDGWTKTPVYPPTPLSAILLIQDSSYTATFDSTRRSILRDETTDLQEKAVIHLKGRVWPVRKTAEGIAAVGLEEGRATVWPDIGWRALATLRECQIIVINEEKKSVKFYPEDVRSWSANIDLIFVEYECRYIWTHANMKLSKWISDREASGWTMQWPLTDGTMEELRSATEKLNLNSAGKLKETLRSLVGRGQSIQNIVSWDH